MFSNFKELFQAHGFDNHTRVRDDLSYDEERCFVSDCFDLYERIGFADTFGTPYTGEKKYVGMKFTVIDRVHELTESHPDGADLECLPMWNIQLENGDTLAAYPEEICLAERQCENKMFRR